jgi:hypothetical protein
MPKYELLKIQWLEEGCMFYDQIAELKPVSQIMHNYQIVSNIAVWVYCWFWTGVDLPLPV